MLKSETDIDAQMLHEVLFFEHTFENANPKFLLFFAKYWPVIRRLHLSAMYARYKSLTSNWIKRTKWKLLREGVTYQTK